MSQVNQRHRVGTSVTKLRRHDSKMLHACIILKSRQIASLVDRKLSKNLT